MTIKVEYAPLASWYWYAEAKYPNFKWYIVDSKRIVKSGAGAKGSDIGYLQPGDIIWLDFSEQDLGWIRVGQVKPFIAPDFVYPLWRKALVTLQPVKEEREAWIEFDLGHVKPYTAPVEPPVEPPIEPPVEPEVVWQFSIFGYTVTITKNPLTSG